MLDLINSQQVYKDNLRLMLGTYNTLFRGVFIGIIVRMMLGIYSTLVEEVFIDIIV